MHNPTPDGISWLATSAADYDKRLVVKGHQRTAADQGGLFFVATPTADRAAPPRENCPARAICSAVSCDYRHDRDRRGRPDHVV